MPYEKAGPAIMRMNTSEIWKVYAEYSGMERGFEDMKLSEPSGYGQSYSIAEQMTTKIKDAIKDCVTLIDGISRGIHASINEYKDADDDNKRQYAPIQERFQNGGESPRCYKDSLVSRPL